MQNELNQYIAELNKIYKAGNATEHTYRPALQRLLENITQGLAITNEPKRIACGAPDYIVTRNNIPIGYIEAKDMGTDLNNKAYKEQFNRYKQSLNNLIITDYRIFQLFVDGELVMTADVEQSDAFAGLIQQFTGYQGQSISSSEQLSKMMAAKARLMANIIEKALDEKDNDDDNSLNGQLKGFQDVLIPEISHKEFADIYAQTIAYGMFAACLNNEKSGDFTRQTAAELIPQSNPFLRKLFQYIAGYDLDVRIRWAVDDLADLFNQVDVLELLKEFDAIDHDPIIHFYETFLAEYDPALRKSRGVWYTPQPVVQFIVQAVDDILKQEFELLQGLADTSKVQLKQQIKQKDGTLKEEQKEYHKVQLLDPATGTGTFLAEVVRNVYRHFSNQQGMWSGYAEKHLIPRLNGFEILMASYAMAHLQLDRLLKETGYNPDTHERLRIYLTNSLEEAHPKTEIPFAKWLSDEANEANRIKQDVPVMVVLGNPPYNGESINKGKWIKSLIEQYKKEPQNPSNNIPDTKWLNNDYVKFIRFGQYFIHKNQEGILAYITDNSFLDSLTFRGMRYDLLNEFDKIFILNLHGNSLKQETSPDGSKDENVFDIQQGVSINVFVKTGKKQDNELAEIFYFDIFGKRNEKYDYLLNNSVSSVNWDKLNPEKPFYFFVPKNNDNKEEYDKGFKIDELFNLNGVGICSKRDEFTIHSSKEKLITTIKKFVSLSDENAREHFNLGKDTDWKLSEAKKDLTNTPDFSKITKINYRPFDIRYTYHSNNKGFHARPVYNVMQHFTKGENLGLVVSKKSRQLSTGYMFITNTITDLHILDSVADSTYIFPLYLYLDNFGVTEKVANLNAANLTGFQNLLGFTPTSEQIFDYIYAVLHSPAYRDKYKEFLKIDFPRVPYPQDAAQFGKLATFGSKLRRLHLLEGVEPLPTMATYPKQGNNEVEKLSYKDDKVWINDTQYFDQVPLEAWEFYIGGYQPAQKWLKDRKGRILDYEDIRHYQRIIRVLKETGEVQKEIDEQ
ncbi:MAG: N-6 DNA methylase [Candidatus Symbiothrix sp.]|jgi:predicted helicase|nr:N-6 DNA methylase [Candidatus Symbiothrix sp.]